MIDQRTSDNFIKQIRHPHVSQSSGQIWPGVQSTVV
jgi:hypothetical protein